MLNLHNVFHKSLDGECFHGKLEVDAREYVLLMGARNDIRRHLRTYMEKLTKERLGAGNQVSPKFFMQGSCAYKTLNDPAHNPPQEIDLDDGVYLPMSLLGGAAPTITSDQYFAIVEYLLEGLAKQRGWTIDRSKNTCCRVRISSRSHVDIPLYAIPDAEFEKLKAEARGYGFDSLREAAVRADTRSWLRLSSDSVWLAIRGGQWKLSDPRKVADWVDGLVAVHGEQFIRVCRYLKAWRDHHWVQQGPSSILLMVTASKGFEKNPGRDDLAMLAVGKGLANQLANDVFNPLVDPAEQINSLDVTARQGAYTKAIQLHSGLAFAIQQAENAGHAIPRLVQEFGDRIPRDHGRIKVPSPAEVVRATPAKVVPAPAIQRVRSG